MVITAQKPFSSGIGGAWFAKLGTKVCLPAAARGVKKEKTLSDKCQIPPPPLFRLKIPTEDNQEADRGAGGTLDCGLGLTDSFFCFVPDLRSLSLSDAAQKCVCVCERDLYVVHMQRLGCCIMAMPELNTHHTALCSSSLWMRKEPTTSSSMDDH